MSTNDAECQTKARKIGGWLGAGIFFALWLLSSVGIVSAAVAGVISWLILERLVLWATCGLPEKAPPMSAEEAAALRSTGKVAAPAPAKPVAAAPKAAPAPVAAPVKAAEPAKAEPVKAEPVKVAEPVKAAEPVKPAPVLEPAIAAAAPAAAPAAPARGPAAPAGGKKGRPGKR